MWARTVDMNRTHVCTFDSDLIRLGAGRQRDLRFCAERFAVYQFVRNSSAAFNDVESVRV